MTRLILFFDTETSGLLDYKLDLMDPSQPRICQIAAILVNESGEIVEEFSTLIKPDGWTIPEEVAKINHCTTEKCDAEGMPMIEALSHFNAMKEKCHARAAYNITYDKRMLAREANIYGIPHNSDGIETHCIMNMATPICNLPPTEKMMAAGRRGNKSPKLSEAYFYFFGKELEGAHDALVDVKACKEIYFKILSEKGTLI